MGMHSTSMYSRASEAHSASKMWEVKKLTTTVQALILFIALTDILDFSRHKKDSRLYFFS